MQKVVIATHNAGKVKELGARLAETGWEMVGMEAYGLAAPEENGVTFQDNAAIKAENAARLTGLWALADDSGLEVDALDGRPGVQTAHFGGWERLLDAMKGVPEGKRGAQFVCVLALQMGDTVTYFRGSCRGHISSEARGDGGFGYDPVFIPEGETRTFAEMSKEDKEALSHRGAALRALLAWRKGL